MEDIFSDLEGHEESAPEVAAPVPLPPGYGGPMPLVGETVHYHPRPTEIRRGRKIHAALVTWRNEEARTLDLAIIYEASDVRQQDGVREWPGGDERGWERMPSRVPFAVSGDDISVGEAAAIESLRAEVQGLRELLLGRGDDQYEAPAVSFLAMLDSQDVRLDEIEARATGAGNQAKAPAGKGSVQVTGAVDAKKLDQRSRKVRRASKTKRKGK